MNRVLIASAVFLSSIGGAKAIETETQVADCIAELPTPRRGHWAYRLIDGRKCWYEGKPGRDKSSLRWTDRKPAEAGHNAEQPATDAKASPLAMEGETTPAVEIEAFIDPEDGSCCWPSRKDDNNFDDRWRALGLQPETK
jgi:hypothetical protein